MYVYKVEIEFRLDGTDLTATVSERKGMSGTNPITQVLHDSHSLDDAIKAVGRAVRYAAADIRNDLLCERIAQRRA